MLPHQALGAALMSTGIAKSSQNGTEVSGQSPPSHRDGTRQIAGLCLPAGMQRAALSLRSQQDRGKW